MATLVLQTDDTTTWNGFSLLGVGSLAITLDGNRDREVQLTRLPSLERNDIGEYRQ